MQINKVSSEKLKREYDIIIPATDISAKVEKRLAEIGKKMKVPGFRPGKAPIALMKKNYGQSVLGEVVEEIIGQTSMEALKKENLRPALRPKFEIVSFADNADLKYKMKFEIIPEMPEINFEKLKLDSLKAEAANDEINEGLERLAARFKNFKKVEEPRAAKKGDAVLIDFKGFIDDKAFEGGEAEGFQLELGSGQFIPGFEDQLIGAKAGEDRKVNVPFPKDYHNKEFAGKKALFEVKIHEVQQVEAPEINDEFAKKSGFEDLAKLKEAVKKQLNADFAEISRTLLKKELFDALEKKCDFHLPSEMLDLEFDAIWKSAEKAKKDDPDFSPKAEEKLKKEYKKMAERRVKLGIFLAELGRKNEITVSSQELSKIVMEKARQFPGQEQMVVDYFVKNSGALEELKGPLIEDKVVDFILGKATIKEKNVSSKELFAAADKLQEEAEKLGTSGLAAGAHGHHHDDESDEDDFDDGRHVHGPGCNH